MSDLRSEELWARFVAGGALSPAEERELLEALHRDPSLAGTLADDVEVDGLLRALSQEGNGAEAAARAFLDAIVAEREATRFVQKVQTRIRQEASWTGDAPPSKETRKSSRRPSPNWIQKVGGLGNQGTWFPVLVAAGLLVGLVLLLGRFSGAPSVAESEKAEMVRRERAKAAYREEEAAQSEKRRQIALEDLARAERARREAEAGLAKFREEERQAEQARAAAAASQDGDFRRKVEAEFEEALRRRREQEEKLARLRQEEERAQEEKPPRQSASPEPTRAERRSTAPLVARLERIEGEGWLLDPAGRSAARGGEVLLLGQGVETGPAKSAAILVYPDKTRIEMGANTEIAELKAEGGKRVAVRRGEIHAVVAKQTKDQAMVFATPQGEAVVLGTSLRIIVDPDPKKGTRLEVEEGKVRFSNLEKKSLDVTGGHFAVAAAGADLVARSSDPSAGVPRRGLALWLRADVGVTQNAGAVLAWADRSGNNRLAVQRKPSQQPAFVPSGVHGLPSVRFDGVDDCLTFACPVAGLPGMTLFLVAAAFEERAGGPTRAGHAALYWRELEDHGTVLLAPFPGTLRFGFGTGQPYAVVPYTRPDSLGPQYSLTTALKNGAEQVLFVNGRESLRLNDRRPVIAKCEEIGQIGRGEGDTYFPGEISEILVYTRALGAGDRLAVEQYLLGKYLSK
jgi:hypothetical protein